MAYEPARLFDGCIDINRPDSRIIYCNSCLEINCVKNKIRKQVEDLSSPDIDYALNLLRN